MLFSNITSASRISAKKIIIMWQKVILIKLLFWKAEWYWSFLMTLNIKKKQDFLNFRNKASEWFWGPEGCSHFKQYSINSSSWCFAFCTLSSFSRISAKSFDSSVQRQGVFSNSWKVYTDKDFQGKRGKNISYLDIWDVLTAKYPNTVSFKTLSSQPILSLNPSGHEWIKLRKTNHIIVLEDGKGKIIVTKNKKRRNEQRNLRTKPQKNKFS